MTAIITHMMWWFFGDLINDLSGSGHSDPIFRFVKPTLGLVVIGAFIVGLYTLADKTAHAARRVFK